MSEFLIHLNDENFDTVIQSEKTLPVFVDFWAPWCGPCRMLAPAYENAAKEFSRKAIFAKYNVDESHQIAAENGIQSIPTILVFKNGALVGNHLGLMSSADLSDFINQFI